MMELKNWLSKSKIFIRILLKTLLQILTKCLLYFQGMINQLNLDQSKDWIYFLLYFMF